MIVLDYSKKMEQLCREAYLLKKDQVIKLREVLTRMETSGYAGCDKRCSWKGSCLFCKDRMGNAVTAGFFSCEKNSKSTAFLLLLRQALWP